MYYMSFIYLLIVFFFFLQFSKHSNMVINEGTRDCAVITNFRFNQRCWKPQGSSEHNVKLCCSQFQHLISCSCSQPFSFHKANFVTRFPSTDSSIHHLLSVHLTTALPSSFLCSLPLQCFLAAVLLPWRDHNNGPSLSENITARGMLI